MAGRNVLNEVLLEKNVESPIKGYPQLLLESWELAEINGPPEPPGHEPRKVDAEDSRHTRALADRGKQTEGFELKRSQWLSPRPRHNIRGENLALA